MHFALMYYCDPASTGPTRDEIADWLAFDEEVRSSGAFVYEAGLQPVGTAQTVSVRAGRAVLDDGGIVGGAGEAIAGFFVVDVPDVTRAVEWARRVPTATYGKVEVRPVVAFPA